MEWLQKTLYTWLLDAPHLAHVVAQPWILPQLPTQLLLYLYLFIYRYTRRQGHWFITTPLFLMTEMQHRLQNGRPHCSIFHPPRLASVPTFYRCIYGAR